MGTKWPIANPLVISADNVECADEPNQAPSMDIETVKKLEPAATNPQIGSIKAHMHLAAS